MSRTYETTRAIPRARRAQVIADALNGGRKVQISSGQRKAIQRQATNGISPSTKDAA
jgi:hypothetical protein